MTSSKVQHTEYINGILKVDHMSGKQCPLWPKGKQGKSFNKFLKYDKTSAKLLHRFEIWSN